MEDDYNRKRMEDARRARDLAEEFAVRERWTRTELIRFQQRQLDSIVRHAVKHSPFYKKLYRSVPMDGPVAIETLPVIDKRTVMDNFDRVVTDARLKLGHLYDYMDNLSRDDYYMGEYRVLTTSGSTGLKGVFIFDREAWIHILASINRATSMMGLSPLKRMRIASIGANSPLHLSYRRAVSMDFGFHDYRRLEASWRIDDLVRDLNAFQPEYLHTYSSVASLLAVERKARRLRIQPKVIITSAELLTDTMRKTIQKAWNVIPFKSYSTTEGILGIECRYHNGIHIFEDLGIVEVVDEKNKPVPDGSPGMKILFTNLYQYTQPVIRYEISDMVTISSETCPCGCPFQRIVSIEGRNDDILYLEGLKDTSVAIPPFVFHGVIALFRDIIEYQIIHRDDGLHFRFVLSERSKREETGLLFKNRMRQELEMFQVICPNIHIKFIDHIERDPQKMGKIKLVISDIQR
ncbi:MAG: phenylacetate--CoA ligase family protein [Deltaproteobacteria bacterium]|nr:phenylacetate--CoA ligase family protein [Deltaproteobacteria bacterium]